MKKVLLIIMVICSTQFVFAQQQVQYGQCINGIWGNWGRIYTLLIKGEYNDFIIYPNGEHPSNYFLRVKTSFNDETGEDIINSSSKRAKDIRKKHLKEGEWFVFDGYIDFYSAKNFEEFVKNFRFGLTQGATSSSTKGVKLKVIVKVKPFKDKDGLRTYNIVYEDSGLGISLY